MDSTAFLARATLLCQQLVNKSLTQPLNRQLSKPNASWDYQWSASNNKSCFQHEKWINIYRRYSTSDLILRIDFVYFIFPFKSLKRHCSSRLDYKAGQRNTVAPKTLLAQQSVTNMQISRYIYYVLPNIFWHCIHLPNNKVELQHLSWCCKCNDNNISSTLS